MRLQVFDSDGNTCSQPHPCFLNYRRNDQEISQIEKSHTHPGNQRTYTDSVKLIISSNFPHQPSSSWHLVPSEPFCNLVGSITFSPQVNILLQRQQSEFPLLSQISYPSSGFYFLSSKTYRFFFFSCWLPFQLILFLWGCTFVLKNPFLP